MGFVEGSSCTNRLPYWHQLFFRDFAGMATQESESPQDGGNPLIPIQETFTSMLLGLARVLFGK